MGEDKKPEDSSTSLEAPAEQGSTSLEQPEGGSPIAAGAEVPPPSTEPPKKPSGLKAIFHKVNIYLLIFVLLVVVAGVVFIVSYLNASKTPSGPDIATQNLTENALKQLANSDATVGDTGQTLTIQGNAIFSGQVLVRSDLNVAGAIKLGGDLTAQNFTASGTVNLGNTQIQGLQVANGSTFKGDLTAQGGLNVAGAASFNGPITANQITATTLILGGNAVLQIPNHIAFTGPAPSRSSVDRGVLGGSGSASVDGSDTTGTINVNTGSGTHAGCFISINFNKPFTKTPHVIVSPVGSGAGQMDYYVNRSNTSMSLCTANAPPAQSVFAFDYFVTS